MLNSNYLKKLQKTRAKKVINEKFTETWSFFTFVCTSVLEFHFTSISGPGGSILSKKLNKLYLNI
jgi:hypothetical protein